MQAEDWNLLAQVILFFGVWHCSEKKIPRLTCWSQNEKFKSGTAPVPKWSSLRTALDPIWLRMPEVSSRENCMFSHWIQPAKHQAMTCRCMRNRNLKFYYDINWIFMAAANWSTYQIKLNSLIQNQKSSMVSYSLSLPNLVIH